MSLEGSIREFGLAEILQLISMQKKSGVVSITHESNSTTLHFDNGQLVFATSIKGGETKRLGEILVNAGKMTNSDVSELLRKQESTKERIGNLFVSSGHVTTDDVKEALQQQLMDVIFHVLRWKDGYYKFRACEIDYDRIFQIPVQTDFILMEGARMVDEWSYIESKIPSDNIVFSQTEKGSEIEHLFSKLSHDESTVYNLVDGKRRITDIINDAQINKIPLYRILLTLMMSGLIIKTSSGTDFTPESDQSYASDDIDVPPEATEEKISPRMRMYFAFQAAALIFILCFILILFPVNEIAGLHGMNQVSELFKHQRTRIKLERVKRATGYYILVKGRLPDTLNVLASEKYIGQASLSDEWSNDFIFEAVLNDIPSLSYRIFSPGKDHTPSTSDDIF